MTSDPSVPVTPATPISAQAARVGVFTIVISVLLQFVPVQDAAYVVAVSGACAWITAAWRPTAPALQWIWAVLNALGANVGFAKNIPAPALPQQ